MYKICYIIGQLRRAGAEGQLYELVKNLDKEKFDPRVVSLSHGGYWSDKIRQLGIEVIEIRRKKSKEFARLLKLIKIIKKIKPDIVHSYLFEANAYGRIAAVLNRVPVIITAERSLPMLGYDMSVFRLCIDKLLSLFNSGIICNSYKASEILVNKYFYNTNKIFTVHNGKEIAVYKSQTGSKFPANQKYIVIVGSLEPVKNQRLFLDMAKKVLDSFVNPNIHFLVIGKGPLEDQLKKHASKIGIEDNVTFAGERMDVPDLLHSSYIFVMTSLYEGISNAIMEAMLAGLPVIATDVGGNNELVKHGVTGYLCESNNVKSIAEKVTYLINNENEAVRMGVNGKERILNEFAIEKMVQETESIYMKFVE